MLIGHDKALSLEWVVRRVYSLDTQGGMGGLISADHFAKFPFDAALIALAPLWRNCTDDSIQQELGDFLLKWDYYFRRNNAESFPEKDIDQYTQELRNMVSKFKRKTEN